jgi:hypothetical protein
MSLLQIFFRHILEYDGVDVEADPLRHPDLAVMSQRELADLPLMPANLGRHLCPSSGLSATFSPKAGRSG